MAQIYEQYWSYTAAFTDLFGSKAINTLKTCIEFLDEHEGEFFSKDTYENLQFEIQSVLGIDLISIRKAINQFVKLGFKFPLEIAKKIVLCVLAHFVYLFVRKALCTF